MRRILRIVGEGRESRQNGVRSRLLVPRRVDGCPDDLSGKRLLCSVGREMSHSVVFLHEKDGLVVSSLNSRGRGNWIVYTSCGIYCKI